ncbi:transposable element Tcb2 transposase [Trichonephila clavipes]|nr:transposable element Tcb2 transposase [Trichonephila clavipes]
MIEVGWSARRVVRRLDRSDCVVRSCQEDCHIAAASTPIQAKVTPSSGAPVSSPIIQRRLAEGHLGSGHPLHVLPLTPTHRDLCLEWCHARRNWTAAKWNQVVSSDESRFNLSSEDNNFRMWSPCDEHRNYAFALQRHTAPTAGMMVWGKIAYNTRSPNIDPWYHGILQPHVFTLMQLLPGALFQQKSAQSHTARVS